MDNQKYMQLTEGVLLCQSSDDGEVITHQGIEYRRFMDRFYIDRSPYRLSSEQVSALCRARADIPDLINRGPGNESVKRTFTSFIEDMAPENILEIGAGNDPTLPIDQSCLDYILSDFDNDVVSKNRGLGREYIWFSEQSSLAFDDGYFHLIFAVFVFHFKIYPSQIEEISRCLSENGVLLANIYHLESDERDQIAKAFENAGLLCARIKDPSNCCKKNEYWLFSHREKTLEDMAGRFSYLILPD